MIKSTIELLAAALPVGRVLIDEPARRARAHDYWSIEAIHDLAGVPATPPPCVVCPESTDEVATVLRIANEQRTPVVPFGAGSGVCGAVLPGAGAIVVDMRKMSRLVSVSRDSLIAVVEAGLMGDECERLLQSHGLTLGHFPQSIALSTVGGWVATRASGQLSTRYGNMEDLLLALEVVLPGGKVVRSFAAPRAATGPDLRQLFLGSEGTLGIVTEVTLKCSPKPSWQRGFAARLGCWDDGLEITRELLQAGWRPAVMRLYDESEAGRHFQPWIPEGGSLILLMSEGTTPMAAALELEIEAARQACERRGARIIPEDVEGGPLKHWLEHRNNVPSWDSLLRKGLIADTIEVAATWDRIAKLYPTVTAAIQAVPGVVAATGHTSHGYTTGVNIYFTFVGASSVASEQERIYRDAWNAAMRATVDCGGTIAHHHGIGRIRRDWLPIELGEAGIEVLRSVKRALDPNGIMNPGVLL